MISKTNVNAPNNNLNTINPVVERTQQCLTIGRIAPDFTAITTDGIITMSQYRGKWVLLFSHPGDFTHRLKGNL